MLNSLVAFCGLACVCLFTCIDESHRMYVQRACSLHPLKTSLVSDEKHFFSCIISDLNEVEAKQCLQLHYTNILFNYNTLKTYTEPFSDENSYTVWQLKSSVISAKHCLGLNPICIFNFMPVFKVVFFLFLHAEAYLINVKLFSIFWVLIFRAAPCHFSQSNQKLSFHPGEPALTSAQKKKKKDDV